MDFTPIATVEAAHAEVIREALEGAGLNVKVVRLRPFVQLDHLRHQARPLVDIEVEDGQERRARSLLELLEIEAAEAAGRESLHAAEPDRLLTTSPAAEAPLSPGFGLALSLVFPVAGPIYSGARPLLLGSIAAHLAGLVMYAFAATGHWYRNDLHEQLGLLVLAAARLLDVVGTLHTTARHNAALDERRAAAELPGAAATTTEALHA